MEQPSKSYKYFYKSLTEAQVCSGILSQQVVQVLLNIYVVYSCIALISSILYKFRINDPSYDHHKLIYCTSNI